MQKIQKQFTLKQNSGFTLFEITTVVFILVTVGTIATIAGTNALKGARISKAESDLVIISSSLDFLRQDTKEWPGHQTPKTVCSDLPGGCPSNNEICDDGCTYDFNSGFAGFMIDDTVIPYANWNGPYIANPLEDPWGSQYFFDTDYSVNGEDKAVIGSYGPNGVGNNQYDSDDIIEIVAF